MKFFKQKTKEDKKLLILIANSIKNATYDKMSFTNSSKNAILTKERKHIKRFKKI